MIINYIHKLNDPINAQLKENVRKFLIILFFFQTGGRFLGSSPSEQLFCLRLIYFKSMGFLDEKLSLKNFETGGIFSFSVIFVDFKSSSLIGLNVIPSSSSFISGTKT